MNYTELSKMISHALRHEPLAYNLKLDSQGWVSLSDLVNSLNEKGANITEEIIIKMVEHSDKKRHQIIDNQIRAYYGHSLEEKITKQSQKPPQILYHGTLAKNRDSILEKGLLPMKRQYVHLSVNEFDAIIIANRRKGTILVAKINAQEAYEDRISFFKEENNIWLSEFVPSRYLIL